MSNLMEAIQRGRMDFTSSVLFKEHFSHVQVEDCPIEFFAGGVILPARIVVSPVWKGVDRPNVGGWSCGTNRKLAMRLKAAIESGAAYCQVEVKKDVNGQSYVAATSMIIGRTMNADLKRLGY